MSFADWNDAPVATKEAPVSLKTTVHVKPMTETGAEAQAGAAPVVSPTPAVAAEQTAEQTAGAHDSIDRTGARVRVDDKAMINCRADVNQLLPLKYKWAWEKYLAGCNNHWMPTEVSACRPTSRCGSRPTA